MFDKPQTKSVPSGPIYLSFYSIWMTNKYWRQLFVRSYLHFMFDWSVKSDCCHSRHLILSDIYYDFTKLFKYYTVCVCTNFDSIRQYLTKYWGCPNIWWFTLYVSWNYSKYSCVCYWLTDMHILSHYRIVNRDIATNIYCKNTLPPFFDNIKW